jgi:PEGA domain
MSESRAYVIGKASSLVACSMQVGRKLVLGAVLGVLFGLSFALPAAAGNDANGDDPQLEAPIQEGIALRRAGNDEAALSLFLDLERSNPDSIRVLLHITAAAQATGRWMMAYSYLRKAATHKNEPYYVRYRSAIKSIEDATTQHVGQFRVLGAPAGAEVRLNGELIGTLPMTDAKPVEVGQYTLEVSLSGYYPLRRAVSIGPGSALTQEAVELRVGTPASDSASTGGKNSGSLSDRQVATERAPWWHARWVTWTLAAATAATAATAVAALVYRNERADHWNSSSCLDGTKTRQEVCGGVRDDISLGQNLAVGTGIAAVVFGGAALTQVILSPDRTPVATSRAPRFGCSPGLASVLCTGSF